MSMQELADDSDDNALNFELSQGNHVRIIFVLRLKKNGFPFFRQPFEREFPVKASHDNISGNAGSVRLDNGDVAIENPSIDHRIPFDRNKDGLRRAADKIRLKIDRFARAGVGRDRNGNSGWNRFRREAGLEKCLGSGIAFGLSAFAKNSLASQKIEAALDGDLAFSKHKGQRRGRGHGAVPGVVVLKFSEQGFRIHGILALERVEFIFAEGKCKKA